MTSSSTGAAFGTRIRGLAVIAAAMVLIAACGSSSPSPTSPPASAGGGGGGGTTITATETEFKISLSADSAPAGTVTFTADNKGTVQHELVLFKTDDDPAALPMASDGSEMDEDASSVTHIAEVEDVDPGTTKSFTVDDLEPGKYVLLCNVPAHYASGMHVAFTVTGS
ncbi:MAG TPA: sulfocyanin-like copper-binding protein [Candidatus Limnocylindrales bacterium]|nr:sulfocyanin-like copper-binding protein [Candidatus Limnocylindrales bacterium]